MPPDIHFDALLGMVLGQAGADSLERVLQQNIAYLRTASGCSVPIDFDRALFQHLRYAFEDRNIMMNHIEANFDYFTINKRYHLFLLPDSRAISTFAKRQTFQRSSLIPQGYTYEHVTTSLSRPIDDICRGGRDRGLAVQAAVFTSIIDAAISGLLPYQFVVSSTVCFTRDVNPDLRTAPDEVFNLPNSRFLCCRVDESLEKCLRSNQTINDFSQVKGYSLFLGFLYAIVYCYILPLMIAWVLCDVNCLEDGRTLTYVINPKTVYFGYGQLGFPPIIKRITFILLGISGYALMAIIALTNRSPVDQLVFVVCFLFLSVVLMFSAKRLVIFDALRPTDRYLLGFFPIFSELHPQQKGVVASLANNSKSDLFLQQQDNLLADHPDITVYPSISDSSRLLFTSKYWSRYVKMLRRIYTSKTILLITLPLLAPILLVAFLVNTLPIVQLSVFIVLQIRARLLLYTNGLSTLLIFICCIILFIGYVALLLYIPCVLILCLYYTVLTMLHSIHLLMVGLAVAIVIYQLGVFICHENDKFAYMTECVVRLNLVYLRYEGAMHRSPCCEQLIRSVPLNPDHIQINSIFYDSLVKLFFPLSHSIKVVCYRSIIFIFLCTFLFVVLTQCGAPFYVTQAISFNLLVAILVPKLLFCLWPCCSSMGSLLPSPSVEQAIYIFIDDWYRKTCQNSPKPSSTILKIGPGIDNLGKMTPQLGTRDIVIANMMDQLPYSDNYYGTITTNKYSGNGSSPMTNYADTTLPESGRYTLTSSHGGHRMQNGVPSHINTLPNPHPPAGHARHQTPPVSTTAMSNSLIKHAVFAPKHNHHTASTADTGSEVDSILYYNDIVSKHPSERLVSAANGRLYDKPMLDVNNCKTSPMSNNLQVGDSSDNGSSSMECSPLGGDSGSPASYTLGADVRITVVEQRPNTGLATVRSQSETDESVL